MKLFWASDFFERGKSYGFSVHNLRLRRAVAEAGAELVDIPDRADIIVHVGGFEHFKPIDGRPNLLFGQAEFDEPITWGPRVDEATMIVTSSRSSAATIAKHYSGPVHVCPLGVDGDVFAYRERSKPSVDQPFWFLFAGNMEDNRKGPDLVISAWCTWFQHGMPENCHLLMKASGVPGGQIEQPFPLAFMRGYIDHHDLSVADLASMYQQAHAFIFPSLGEGQGLTLLEAMSTGLPSIYSLNSAMRDFDDPDAIGYPLRDLEAKPIWPDGHLHDGPPIATGWAATEESIIATMETAYREYDEALSKGRRAAEHMRSSYTWSDSAARFLEICETALELPITPAAGDEVSPAAIVEATASPR